MKDEKDLKECPICGAELELFTDENIGGWDRYEVGVQCPECDFKNTNVIKTKEGGIL